MRNQTRQESSKQHRGDEEEERWGKGASLDSVPASYYLRTGPAARKTVKHGLGATKVKNQRPGQENEQ